MAKRTVGFDAAIEGIGTVSLVLIPLVVLSMGAFVMINALLDLKEVNERVAHIGRCAADAMHERAREGNGGELSEEEKGYLEQVQVRSRGMLDSSTISFLFEVFAMVIVSAGIYLLARYHKYMTLTERSAKKIIACREILKGFVGDAVFSSEVGGLVLTAFGASFALPAARSRKVAEFVASIREAMRQVRQRLEEGEHQERGMGESQLNVLIDQIVGVKAKLSGLGGEEDVVGFCDESIENLRTAGFVERYKERLNKLESAWE